MGELVAFIGLTGKAQISPDDIWAFGSLGGIVVKRILWSFIKGPTRRFT